MRTTALSTIDGRVLLTRCHLARRPWQRMRGLIGRGSLQPGEGMLFEPAGSIHMFFMRFPIDAIFCDRELVVVDVERDLTPWRIAGRRGAKIVIEVAAGAAADVKSGDQLALATIDV